MPTNINAPNITAVTASPGTPRVMRGIIAPPVVALFAHSDAANPSMEPFPYNSGLRATFFDSSYPIKHAIAPPAPGAIPITIPVIAATSIGSKILFHSSMVSINEP